MTTLTFAPAPVNSTAADAWPAWTDADVYQTGPDADDERWAAERNDAWDSRDDRDDAPDWDAMADEAQALDRLCMGVCL